MNARNDDRRDARGVLVGDLVRSGASRAPADVRARIRSRLMASVATTTTGTRPRYRLAWMAAILAAGVSAATGVGFAAQGSLPGEALYPVKRATERARVALVPTDERADVYVDQADERMREVERLLSAGASAGTVDEAVDGFGDAARRAVDVEADEYAAQRRAEEIRRHVQGAPPPVRDVIEPTLEDLGPPGPHKAPPPNGRPPEAGACDPAGGRSVPDDGAVPPVAPETDTGRDGGEEGPSRARPGYGRDAVGQEP